MRDSIFNIFICYARVYFSFYIIFQEISHFKFE
jgi:hypothetical protein